MPEVNPPKNESNTSFHDFSDKLCRPGFHEVVRDYIAWRRGERTTSDWEMGTAPLSINLDLTTACNYACDHCIDWDSLNSPVRHDMHALRDSLSELAKRGMRSVILIGGGEPTLHPEFVEIVRFLKQDLAQQLAIVSNGSRNRIIAKAAKYLTKGDWVRLSLDSGTNDTFIKMHKPKSGISLQDICTSAEEIKATKPEITLGFSFVITWRGSQRDDVAVIPNFQEMEAASHLAHQHGFDYISFKPFLNRTAEGAEVLNAAQAQQQQSAIEAIKEGLVRSHATGIKVLESRNLKVLLDGSWRELTKQPKECHMQALRQVISPLGVFNCPAHRGVARARIGDASAWAAVGGLAAPAAAATGSIIQSFDASCECAEVTCLYNATNHMIQEVIDGDGELPSAPALNNPDFFL